MAGLVAHARWKPTPTQNVTEQDVFDITAYMLTFK